MTAKLDDGFRDHPRWIEASCAAVGMWAASLAYSCKHATDGRIPAAAIDRLAPRESPKQRTAIVAELLDSGAWEANADGSYTIHDFLVWNDSKAEVKQRRELGRRGALARWGSGNASRNADGMSGGTAHRTASRTGHPNASDPIRSDPTYPDHPHSRGQPDPEPDTPERRRAAAERLRSLTAALPGLRAVKDET